MSIPTSFKLFNRSWSVVRMEESVAKTARLHGDCDYDAAQLRVAESGSKENEEHTFYHELAHALLRVTTKPKLSNKEDFVDSLGAGIHQFMQTKKGKLE